MKILKPLLLTLIIGISALFSGCNNGMTTLSMQSNDATQIVSEIPVYPTPAATLSELVVDLSSDDPLVRVVSMEALEKYGDEAYLAVHQLRINLYFDGTSEVRRSSAIALGRLGSLAKEAVPDLISIFENDTAPGVVFSAIEALGNIGDSSAVPRLAVALNCGDVFNKQMGYMSLESCHDYGISIAEAISKLTGEHFTDAGGPGHLINDDGIPYIVLDAREWWEKEGQYRDWVETDNR